MLRDTIIAAVRTGVAAAVGFFVAVLTARGVQVDPELEATLVAGIFGLTTAVYNAVVSLLERKVHPLFGVLLGVPKAPSYSG